MNEDLDEEAFQSHARFVRRVRETGLVWGLRSRDGWAVCESEEYEDTDVYPFWSDAEEARIHCTDDWRGHAPESLPLDLFVNTWLSGMSEDGVLVGTNWDAQLSGLEIAPDELAEELTRGD